MIRVGFGYDLHRLALGKTLRIGGIEIPSPYGCVAHSDGDVLIHALIDALVGPFFHTDVGTLFPDDEDSYKGVLSLSLLQKVKERYLQEIIIHNIDIVIILDAPKLFPYREAIRDNVAGVLGIDSEVVNVKAKTSEHTALETIVCYVVTLLEKRGRQ